MLSYTCVNCNQQIADRFCKNEFCKENRLFCFEKCVRTQQKHIDHIDNTEKIDLLPNYFKDISIQCQEMIEQLDILFTEIQQLFEQFKNDLVQKYQISERNLKQLNSNHINNAIFNFVKFGEKKKTLLNIFNKTSQQYKLSLQDCIEELKINMLEVPSQEIASQQFQYELIQNSFINSKLRCCSFAFNDDSSIIVNGLENGVIIIYEFINEVIKKKDEVKNHKDAVYCLQFMKKVNQFISGGQDAIINIWSIDPQNKWYNSLKIDGQSSSILSLIIDNSNNTILTGNRKSQINVFKVFNEMKDWQCIQTLIEHKVDVDILSLSLNPKQNLLISCAEEDNYIKLYQKNNQIWSLFQNIKVQQWGYRLCFIDNSRFTFQSFQSTYLNIYENNLLNNLFTKTNDVQIQQNYSFDDILFPWQFIQSKSILMCKSGQYINLFTILPNKEIKLIQTINFLNEQLYGAFNENGEYLLTWAVNSEQIQIRKYKEFKS
ncbi:unnamed protein product [Paramecium sonneborni]|uniref:WD40-repeat-containing domain n=1 Tax=Paramecium sonneborni TaxID=65129 RepID=A0A8S1LRR7_9CILI|nr:unnamed protein product [Paramecium sonneborni]